MLKFGALIKVKNSLVNFVKLPLAITKGNDFNLPAQSVRYTSFFNRLTGEQLWNGVAGVSNAGKKKGRGRTKRFVRNLNAGQKIGSGKIMMKWPGLNVPVIKSNQLQDIKEDKTKVVSASMAPPPIRKKKVQKVHILDRGWTGRQQRGRRIGPPEPIHETNFEGFESIVLEHKMRQKMSSVLGRRRSFFSVVATGNSNGLIGIGRAKNVDPKVALKQAKARASKRLITIDLIENHTVNHDFFTEYGRTKIFVYRKAEGHGLRCQRLLMALCRLIGIKNLHAKIEGPTNTLHLIRAFIIGLLRQKTYQQIADENQLHLVEFRSDTYGFPKVLASPEKCLSPAEALKNPIIFEEYIMGGKLVYKPDPKIPFYKKLPSWNVYLKRTLYHRNHPTVKLNLLAEYGALESHLTKVYPECTRRRKTDKKSQESA